MVRPWTLTRAYSTIGAYNASAGGGTLRLPECNILNPCAYHLPLRWFIPLRGVCETCKLGQTSLKNRVGR